MIASALLFLSFPEGVFAEEVPIHARVLKVLQSEPKDKQEEFISAILYQYQSFTSQLKVSNMDLERSRDGTFLIDLDSRDWSYVKASVLMNGIPSEHHARVDGARLLIQKSVRESAVIDLANLFNGSVSVNEREYPFEFKFGQSVEKNDVKFKKLFTHIERKEELLESETAFFKRLENILSWSFIPDAHAASSNVVSPLRAMSSSIGGLLRGFVSPVSRSSQSGRVAAVDVYVGSGS